MDAHRILIVDDDVSAAQSLSRALIASGIEAEWYFESQVNGATQTAAKVRPHVSILDLSLDDRRGVEGGFEVLRSIRGAVASCRVVVLTGHGSAEFGVRALGLGAANFIEKPANVTHLAALVRDGILQSVLRRSFEELTESASRELHSVIVGKSAAAVKLRGDVQRAASHNQPVLIRGETGVGKGVCAHAIHRFGLRKGGEFVRYQAGFGSLDLINSDLFGHVKGAFTGATGNRIGVLERADRGTLFLDEVDELPSSVQVTLLGVIQEKRFRCVGATSETASEFRVIAATNCDTEVALSEGKLRRDLYHRIAGTVIDVPPLRDRAEDIPMLCEGILRRLTAQEQTSVFGLSGDVYARLSSYQWPGNIRELESVVESAVYRSQYEGRGEIAESDICLPASPTPLDTKSLTFHDRIEEYKKEVVLDALHKSGGNQVHAARALGIDRTSLRRILGR